MKKWWILAIIFLLAACSGAEVKGEYVNAPSGLRVRSKPNFEGKILKVLPNGTEIDVISESGNWYEIAVGYVYKEFVVDNKPENMTLLGSWLITAYTATGSPCANGNYPTDGYTVACNSLDFGTKIYIDGIGERVVEDRDPSSLGSEWCDIYYDTRDECVQWGSQYKNVYLVGE